MGVGKSTIGRQLARAMHRAFCDSDREIERRTGVSIALIFEIEGEGGFRARESKIIDELASMNDAVIATGGGAVLDEVNRRRLRDSGFTVYLKASIERLHTRTRLDRSRPLLQTPDPRKSIEELVRQRDPLYREVADLVIHTDGRTVYQIISAIRNAWEQS
jgi:shikimate kinase